MLTDADIKNIAFLASNFTEFVYMDSVSVHEPSRTPRTLDLDAARLS